MTITPSPGLCECGCGQPTPIAAKTDQKLGWTRGEPKRFIHGHRARLQANDFDKRWRADPVTGCHIWIGVKNAKGYGRFGDRLAHRIAWERAHGPIPDGLQPDHLCRNPACINVAHIELVTSAENTRRGDRAKLTAGDVRAIRRSRNSSTTLAREYGVSASHITNIRARRAWGDLADREHV